MRAKTSDRLGVKQWRAAALLALAEGGIAAVAIEPLAKQLGVTKGSGYWHFENRDALLCAALDEWETKTTETVIARLLLIKDPRQRLVTLFRQALNGTLDSRVSLALTAAAPEHPSIAAALHRVAHRRLAFLAQCYETLGYSRPEYRAAAAYAAYLGVVTLLRHAADVVPARERMAFVTHLIETHVPQVGPR